MELTIKNGYSACLGMSSNGWYGGVLEIEDNDKKFLPIPDNLNYRERAEYARKWYESTSGAKRKIMLLQPSEEGVESKCIVSAEHIEGPVAPREQTVKHVLCWIEKKDENWNLVLFHDNKTENIISRNQVIRCPQTTLTENGLIFAFETDIGPETTKIEIVGQKGNKIFECKGRDPQICAAENGFVLCYENVSPDWISLNLQMFDNEFKPVEDGILELNENDYLLNADIVWSEEEKSVYIAAESSPRFASTCQMELYRTIPVWKWIPGKKTENLGILPVENRAFQTLGGENIAPIKPYLLVVDGKPEVFFKQHRFTGFRAFGWDLFVCRSENKVWSQPIRASDSTMTSDSDFGLIWDGDKYIGLFPAHENEGGSDSKQSENHRVELVSFGLDHKLERYEIPDDKKAEFRMPFLALFCMEGEMKN